jgi:hypothetical protein
MSARSMIGMRGMFFLPDVSSPGDYPMSAGSGWAPSGHHEPSRPGARQTGSMAVPPSAASARPVPEASMRFPRALLLALALVAPALAQAAPPPAEQAYKAAQALQRYVDGMAASGGWPDYTQPPASDLFRQVFNVDALKALPPPQANDLPWLLEWSQTASAASKAIVMHGITPGPHLDLAAVGRNVERYEDQYCAAADFLIRVAAREMTALVRFVDRLPPEQHTPVRAAGIAKARSGAAEMIAGFLMSTIAGVKPANARLVTAALRDTRDVWAGFLAPDARPRILDLAAQATQRIEDAEAKRTLATFVSALENTE